MMAIIIMIWTRSSLRRLENPAQVQISPEREWPTVCTTPSMAFSSKVLTPSLVPAPFPYRGEASVRGKGKLSVSSAS